MAIVEITVMPVGTPTTSLSPYVAQAYEVAQQHSKLHVSLNPMGTVLEGDIDAIFSCVRDMQERVFAAGSNRVYTILKIDDRRDKDASMSQKLQSVEEKLS